MLSILLDAVRIHLELPDELIAEPFYIFEESQPKRETAIRGTICVRLAHSNVLENHSNEQPQRYETDFAVTEIYKNRICCHFKEDSGWLGLVVCDDMLLCIPDKKMQPGLEAAATIFDYMKGGIFLLLRKYDYYILHSSSLIINGKVIAFSAESGVGKTTHTRFWEKLYCSPIFNGDMLMIDTRSEQPKAIGIPWSGSTGITTKESMPLAGVFFIERGTKNQIREMNEFEKVIRLTERMLSANFNHKSFIENAEKLKNISLHLNCATLICCPNEESAKMAHGYVVEHDWIL